MKIKELIGLGVLVFLILLPLACKTADIPATSPAPTPPSPQQLSDQGFILPAIPRITCERLKQMMDRGDGFILVDTRSPDSYKSNHLPGAINIPNDPGTSANDAGITQELLALPKNKLIVFYCD